MRCYAIALVNVTHSEETMRAMGGAAARQLGFVRGFTRYQWLVFFVVWAGWSLDATDFGLFSLVLRPALTELLGGQPTIAEIGRVGGLLSTVGLLGWAFGGFLFGIIADYLGRVRTLALSILIYSVFTGLQGLSHSPFEFGIYRFFAGVGTGAEIIVGIPLVAEAFAEVHRAKILGVMMTGGAMGSIIGGQVYALIGGFGWRYVFFAGIAPALLLLLIRRGMVEPEHFQAVRERRRVPPRRFPGCRRLRPHAAGHGGSGFVHPLPPARPYPPRQPRGDHLRSPGRRLGRVTGKLDLPQGRSTLGARLSQRAGAALPRCALNLASAHIACGDGIA